VWRGLHRTATVSQVDVTRPYGPGTALSGTRWGEIGLSSPTQADAAVLEQTAKKFDDANNQMMGMLNRLLRELETLQSAWQGHGGLAFQEVKRRWSEDQTTIQRALGETAQAIRTSGTTYSATDASAASRMTGLQGGTTTLPL
jgi:WXG100 family type VII secretion target